jgi:hypothetical protein
MSQEMTTVTAGSTNEGRLVVVVEKPDGQGIWFDRDEAVAVGLSLLQMAGRLYDTLDQFASMMDYARRNLETLHGVAKLQ